MKTVSIRVLTYAFAVEPLQFSRTRPPLRPYPRSVVFFMTDENKVHEPAGLCDGTTAFGCRYAISATTVSPQPQLCAINGRIRCCGGYGPHSMAHFCHPCHYKNLLHSRPLGFLRVPRVLGSWVDRTTVVSLVCGLTDYDLND